ncbi:hypothetical protein SODALDRAFT_362878 [Sodiomyces alkalinus F11]|uniref:RTA1-domain-containing protein n=1 Tax=Sodiomyces alkalinus (strain CBS 110278 / VKM F-3762 / F11) TaxID=1314773 RepID=A0A3N2PNB6_SODAK|nr:hypothetical protein SODALDRAFT_362878 [Sodiomyces alkalinus F11]ROT36015.1 hypothetical protein SODALDRAFT_362878 [Sodiomyces alkalinus F11]
MADPNTDDYMAMQYLPPAYVHKLANGSLVHPGMFNLFGPGANCTLDLCPIHWSVYRYRPQLGVNALFITMYSFLLICHFVSGYRWRSWWFTACMVAGCLVQIIGYAGRVELWYNPWNFAGFLTQAVCITSAPVFFTAAIYVTISKAIDFFSPNLSRMSSSCFYWSFIVADAICLVLQGVGGVLSTISRGLSQDGVDVTRAGLILQVIVLVVFCAFFVDYMVRYARYLRHTHPEIRRGEEIGPRQMTFFGGLSGAIGLILGRCIYRVVELSEGYLYSSRISDEIGFMVFEGLFIALAVFALFIGNPGFGFKECEKRALSSGGARGRSTEDVELYNTLRR